MDGSWSALTRQPGQISECQVQGETLSPEVEKRSNSSDSEGKSTSPSSTGPRFDSQHPHSHLQVLHSHDAQIEPYA